MLTPTTNPFWDPLRQYTQARIGQGHVGGSVPTAALLAFQLAHAAARDAVHQTWDSTAFAAALNARGLNSLHLQTAVSDRLTYLQRPDLGRQLAPASQAALQQLNAAPCDVALVVSNGLSSTAIDRHGLPLLTNLYHAYAAAGLQCAPICLLEHARVAVSDAIGALLKAQLVVMVIGERPGLSAADSVGLYLTYAPRIGNTDADRNCLSNIRPPQGMDYQQAADKLLYLSQQALQLGYSGVTLKDNMNTTGLPPAATALQPAMVTQLPLA